MKLDSSCIAKIHAGPGRVQAKGAGTPQDPETKFIFDLDLSMGGDKNVVAAAVSGPRAVEGFDKEIISAKWMDDGEEGIFVQDTEKKLLTIKCDPFPYGTDMVVNILKIETR